MLPHDQGGAGVRLAGGEPPPADEDASKTHVRVLPTKAARHGPAPIYRGFATVSEVHSAVATLIGLIKEHGLAAEGLGVLDPRNERGGPTPCAGCDGGRTRSAVSPMRRTRTGGAVALAQPPGPYRADDLGESNLLSVGRTRSMDRLAVT